jgi:DNA repair protein RadC
LRDPGAPYPTAAVPVKHLPPELRPREELARRGAEHLSDDTLLAILLRSGRHGRNVAELSRDLLQAFGGLAALSRAHFEEILARKIRGVGRVKAMEIAAALELGRRACGHLPVEPPLLRDPDSVAHLLQPLARLEQQEVFWALHLDTKNRLIGRPVAVSRGLLDASPVHPREVFKQAFSHAAAAVILAHNHPSGDVTPSAEDIRVTRQLVDAARVVGIRVLDHVILGREAPGRPGHLSLREKALVSFDGA